MSIFEGQAAPQTSASQTETRPEQPIQSLLYSIDVVDSLITSTSEAIILTKNIRMENELGTQRNKVRLLSAAIDPAILKALIRVAEDNGKKQAT